MFKSEKTVMVPGEFPVVFECCVQALGDAKVRVKSANPQTGVIAGRTYMWGMSKLDRVDVTVLPGPGQCSVQIRSEFSSVAVTDYGRNARNVDRIINALLARTAPLAGNPAAFGVVTAASGGVPSTRYTAAPMRKLVRETSGGIALQWLFMGLGLLVLLILILGVFLNASQH